MATLVSISARASGGSEDLSAHVIRALPVVVIFPHNQCNCRCVMCDIWRIRDPQQITKEELEQHLASFRQLGVQWVVFSGGEPQMNMELPALARMLRSEGIRVTILTAGMLLESQAQMIAESIDDVIVSLDGPPEIHNRIRRVPDAFQKLRAGIQAVRHIRPEMTVRARCTVQKQNHRDLRAAVESARQLGANSISFLAADLTSSAFNRPTAWRPDQTDKVGLSLEEVEALQREVERLIVDEESALKSGFVVESAAKLHKIVQHFRAHLGQAENVAPRCNAPWVSAVIEASGEVRPCFFHPAFGNLRSQALPAILNGAEALRFRANLDVQTNPICQRCVCSLYLSAEVKIQPTA